MWLEEIFKLYNHSDYMGYPWNMRYFIYPFIYHVARIENKTIWRNDYSNSLIRLYRKPNGDILMSHIDWESDSHQKLDLCNVQLCMMDEAIFVFLWTFVFVRGMGSVWGKSFEFGHPKYWHQLWFMAQRLAKLGISGEALADDTNYWSSILS